MRRSVTLFYPINLYKNIFVSFDLNRNLSVLNKDVAEHHITITFLR